MASVEMNGEFRDDGEVMVTLLLDRGGRIHCTVTVTSVSTEGGRVAVQVSIREVPSYSGPLGIFKLTDGCGTGHKGKIQIHEYYSTTVLLTANSYKGR